MKLYTVISWS